MKKKLLLGVLAMVMTATTAFGMAACSCQGNNGGAGNSTEDFSSLEESSSEVESESSAEESSSEENSSEVENESSSEVESSSEESSSEVESSSEESSIEESSSEESSEDSTPVENDSSEDSSDDSSEVHEHTYEVVDSKAATCTENGYETYTCGGCGDTYTQTLIGYGGHDLITEVEREATCTESGKIVTRCQREFCDYEKVTITYGSHNYYIKETQEATCTTDGYVLYACENCDDEYTLTTEASHNYEESGRVAAQVGVAGSITYTCTKCRDSYSIEIPALPEVDKSATVLLIQDNLPWAEDVNTSLLKTLYQRGTVESYNVVNTSALANVTLTDYGVIFIANDQSTSMYNRLETYTDELTAYVNAGGVLIYGACDEGWGGGGSFTGSLPGGVTTGNYYSVYNYIVDELHPIVTGVYTDGRNLYNELLKGNYCSHTYFNASTLPAETKVILQDGNGRPTLVEYPLGQGTVLASGLTWEYFYVRNHYNMVTNYSKYAFDDMLTYAIMLATIEPCEHNYEAGETVAPTCADKGYTEYICTECGRVIHSDYVDATGEHILGDWYTASEPTCATAGEQRRDCELCDYYETDEIPATGEHNYRTSLELPPVDYTEQNFVGEIIFQCECGASLTREVIWTVVEEQASTCQVVGYRNYVYEYVDPNGEMQVGEYTVVGETLPHRYNGYEIDIDQVLDWDYALQIFDVNGDGEIALEEGLTIFNNIPLSCDEEGVAAFRCDVCGVSYIISVMGDHNWEKIETIPPTCSEEGYTVYGCTGCGAAERFDMLPPTGLHSYNGYEIDIGAEYSWDDVIEIFGEEMEGLRFFSGMPTFCAETSGAVFECSVCGSLISITVVGPHEYSDGNCIYCGEPDPNAPVIDDEYYTEGLVFTLQNNDTYAVTDYTGTATEVVIPSVYNGKAVTSIGYEAFSGCDSLTSVTFGENSQLTSIGYEAFSGCDSLTEVIIPDSVTLIGHSVFYDCESLTSVTFGENSQLTSIGGYAFRYCDSLTEIVIPDSVTSISPYAFLICKNLTDITIEENNTVYKSIDGNLYSKDGTTLIQYAIGKTATSFTIPDSVTSINGWAFYYCDSLTEIVIPDSVTSIGDNAFGGCYRLQYTIKDGLKYLGNPNNPYIYLANTETADITMATIETTCRFIGSHAFDYCEGLTEIVIPDSVTNIGLCAFEYCTSLTGIVIPDSVTRVGSHSFVDCDSLTIYCKAESKPDGWDYHWNSSNCPVVWGYTEEVSEETIEFLEDGTVNFGKYPQTKVTDSATTSALTSLAGALPTVNAGGWTSYGYYISGSNTTDYMWYQDVEYGDSKYRGVYFTSYRPYFTIWDSWTVDDSWQDNNGYTISTLYWFEYEWLNWTILDETNGEYFLLCNSIIDSQEYYDNDNTRTINGKTVYANNYAESNIRKWLNETFYETAFNDLQQSLIQTTMVDNSAKSTNPYGQETYWNNGVNTYACENTNDKIFLLSTEEVTNSNYGFSSAPDTHDTVRRKQTSDYAQSQGAYTYSGGSYDGNGYWWFRSPYYDKVQDRVGAGRRIYYDGNVSGVSSIDDMRGGVVPALKLVL